MMLMLKRVGLMCFFALNVVLVLAQAPGTVFPSGTFGVDYNAFNSKNKREGEWIRVYKSNPKVMYYRGAFLNGVPIGVFEFYNEKGYLKSTVNHIQDTTINDVVNFYADGKTVNSKGRYVGKKVGKTWERQKQGLWEFFDADGRLIRFENYKDNLLNGESKVYFANGQVSHEMIFLNDKMNGPFTEYTAEGKISKKGAYKNGIYDGNIVVNYDSGKKKEEGKFVNGMREGSWNFYLETGLPELTIWFKSDKIEKIVVMLEGITWYKNIDEEGLKLINEIISLSKDLHSTLIRFYVDLNYFAKKNIAKEEIKNLKKAIDDLKEITQDLESVFFYLPQMPQFVESTKQLSLI
jgi:antitoxin component YwqK of YwqJK toxin-antitoxin module